MKTTDGTGGYSSKHRRLCGGAGTMVLLGEVVVIACKQMQYFR
ncbi:unnamed protein product [Brassica oleracea]